MDSAEKAGACIGNDINYQHGTKWINESISLFRTLKESPVCSLLTICPVWACSELTSNALTTAGLEK